VWFEDESRFGMLPRPARRVTARGVKPTVTVVQQYDWFWLYGAVEPATGEHFFIEYSRLDTECFQSYLNEFSQAYPAEVHLWVLDGAQAHRTRALVWPDNIIPLYLPPYSPELNPVERVWLYFKQRIDVELSNIHQLRQRTDDIIAALKNDEVASLTNYPYLKRALLEP
jgi:transposase